MVGCGIGGATFTSTVGGVTVTDARAGGTEARRGERTGSAELRAAEALAIAESAESVGEGGF